MNPRHIHDLMRKRFPVYDVVAHEWINVADRDGPMLERIDQVLRVNIKASDVVIEVNRRLGTALPLQDAAAYIGRHFGEGIIRVADRDFTGYVVVLTNGVATGWSST
jgi:hypothetical protein